MAELTIVFQPGYGWTVGEKITAEKLNLQPTFTLQGTIGTTSIGDASITEPKFQTGSVSTRALADDSVTAAKLATDSVTADAIAAGAVGSDELATDSVTLAKLDADMVGATGATDGTAGIVPQPKTQDVESFLRGDGTWVPVFDYAAALLKFQQFA